MSSEVSQIKQQGIKGLLPAYFKVIGGVILLVSLGQVFVYALLLPSFMTKDLSKIITQYGVMLGLLLIGWSRHKNETADNLSNRGKALAYSVITSVLMAIVNPVVNYVMDMPSEPMRATSVLSHLLLLYIFAEWALRKRFFKAS